jgi:glucan biosynthesis protein C
MRRLNLELSQERIHYLDSLKVVIVYGIVLFHVSLVFSVGTWIVSNHERSLVLSAFAGFTFPWGIPAMFLIAGADAWFGLRGHSVPDFIRRRFLRLGVPMLIGLFTISPLQRFVTSHNPPPPLDQLPAYYVAFFQGLHFDWTLQFISQYWLHLWFLGYLLAISAVCAPLVVWLRGAAGRRLTERLLWVARRPGGMLLLGVPLALAQVVLRPFFPAYQDWADVATYTYAFVAGAIVVSDRRFELAIRADITRLLAGGVATLIGTGAGSMIGLLHLATSPAAIAAIGVAGNLLWAVFVWSWLLIVLYVGIRWLDHPHPALTYAQKSVLAIYVIHHPIVVTVASFVVTWNLGLWPKFGVILVSVALLTLAVYEFGIRRWTLTRFAFGLGPLPAKPSAHRQPMKVRLTA